MKIKKIPANTLYAVRQRMGAKNEYDTSKDDEIEKLSVEDLVAKFCGWHLGDEGWGTALINKYKRLKEIEEEEKKYDK